MREDFSEFPAKAVRLVLEPPAPGLQVVTREAAHQPDGNWRADALQLPQGGIWTVRVIVTDETGTPIMLDAPIVIER